MTDEQCVAIMVFATFMHAPLRSKEVEEDKEKETMRVLDFTINEAWKVLARVKHVE
jgi:hypothetical protein